MLRLAEDVQVHLALGATDMRKSFDTLAALVREAIGRDPMCGHLFAFCNRRKDRLKVLYWDETGYCLLAKRLERGRFSWPKAVDSQQAVEMTQEELALLLSGMEVAPERQQPWYDWHGPGREASARCH